MAVLHSKETLEGPEERMKVRKGFSEQLKLEAAL